MFLPLEIVFGINMSDLVVLKLERERESERVTMSINVILNSSYFAFLSSPQMQIVYIGKFKHTYIHEQTKELQVLIY